MKTDSIARQHVLLIDDDEDDYLILRDLLREITWQRFELEWVQDIEAARQRLKAHHYDVCLVDHRLTGENGLTLIEEQTMGSPPFILLTGSDDREVDLAATRAGAMDYLLKGHFNAPLLERSIRYATERARREATLAQREATLEAALRQSHLLSTAVLNLNEGMIVTDAQKDDNPIIYVNPAFCAMTGYSAEDVLGRNCRFLQGAETDSQMVQQIRQAVEQRLPFQGVMCNYRKDGAHFWNSLKITPIFAPEGHLTHFVGLQADVTAQHQSELALQLSQANLAKSQQMARLGSWELDLSNLDDINANSLRWSDELFRIFGYEPGQIEVSNEVFFRAVHPEDRANLSAIMAEALAGGVPYSAEHRIILPDGQVRVVQAQAEVIYNEETGQPVKVVGLGQDITERKQSQAALEARTREIVTIWESMTDAFFSLDTQWRFTYINSQTAHLWQRSAEELVGKNIWEEFPAAVGLRFYTEYHRAIAEQATITFEEFYPPANVWREVHVYPSSIGLSVYFRDITERKQSERSLREREEFQRALLENFPNGSVNVFDRELRYVLAAGLGLAQSGLTSHQLVGKTLDEFFLPEEVALVRPYYDRVLGGATVEFEMSYGQAYYNINATPLLTAEGIVSSVLAVAVDITERKKSEETSALLSAIIESSEDAIISKTLEGIITSWNVGAQKLYGYTAQEAIGRPVSFLAPPDLLDEMPRLLEKIRRGEPVNRYETVRVRKDGSRLDISLTLSPIRDAQGNIIGVSSIKHDITQEKRTAQELQNSNARFESIVTNVPGLVYQFVMQPDGSINWEFVGEGFRELFEVGPEILNSQPDWPMGQVHPEDRIEFDRSVTTSRETLLPRNWEGRLRLASGTSKWVQVNSQPRRLPNGATLWNGLILDVTARKEAEEERDRFFTMSLDLLCIADHNGYFKRLNPAFEKTLGFSKAELMAKPFLEWVHPDDIQATVAVIQDIDTGASSLNFTNRYRCRDGSYRWLSWVSVPYEGLIYAAAHDVTALKNAEAALQKANDELELNVLERTAQLSRANEHLQLEMRERQSAEESLYKNHEFLHAVLENTAEGIVACDAQGELTLFNRATREFHGQPRESLPPDQWAQYYSMYFPDGITPMHREDLPLFRALSGERVRDVEMVIAPHHGITRLVTVNGEPLFGAVGEKLGAVVVMHDITGRKQAEVELQRAKDEADAANLAKSEFLSRMSHELRTPLNAILGFGQILEVQNLTPRQLEGVGYILKGGRHLLGLINEVLDIARVEAGHIELSLEPIALHEVVPEVCALVRPLAQERRIRLEDNSADLARSYILADLQRFKQVLINLLSNAIKYNRDGGQVEVLCTLVAADAIAIAVRDTGPGIAPQDLAKLFVPFERLGATSAIEGTGLGLVLSQRLVTAMGGTLEVESTVEQGTTFTLKLPQTQSPEEQVINIPKDNNASHKGEKTEHIYLLLCVEDNPSNLRLIEAILEGRPDIALISAMQGSVGLDLARQHKPDLILLDLDLPDIKGHEVLSRLQQSAVTRDIPVVVVSADATPGQIERLLSAGAKAYLTKPLDVGRFLRTLDQFLAASLD